MALELPLVLKIEVNLQPTRGNSKHPPRWHCRIICPELGKTLKTRVITDPFTLDDHDGCSNYFRCSLPRGHDPSQYASKLHQYREVLFKRLRFDEIANTIQERSLEILICDHHDVSPSRSVHALQWEQLEDLDAWSEYVHVTIRAATVTRIQRATAQVETGTLVYTKNVFNILLVVARRNVFDRVTDVPSPVTIQGTILAIQEHLNRRGASQVIDLEIVRPGSFKELQDHLKRRRTDPFIKVYDAVHFDLHGGISAQNIAYLEFNRYNKDGKLETEERDARDVAVELRASNVKCAILNACKSATSSCGTSANLSCIFLEHDVQNVLAMSHDVLDSTSEKFFHHFYRELILKHRHLSKSASYARRMLRDEPKRYNYNSGVAEEIHDWFTPVVFSDGTEFQIVAPCHLNQKMLARFRPWLRKFKLQVQYAVGLFLSWIAVLWFVPHRIISQISSDLKQTRTSNNSLRWLVGTCTSLFLGALLLHMCRCYNHDQEGKRFLCTIHEHRYDRKNILRVESNLKQGGKMIFFYAKRDVKSNARPLLRFITDIWRRTKFIDNQVVVQAEWFIQRWELDDSLTQSALTWMQSLRSFLRLGLLRFWIKIHSHGVESRTVVILENINVLGPSTHDSQPFHGRAQDRLEDWLRKHCSSKPGTSQPYLVLVGNASGNVTTAWFAARFPKVPALLPVKMTEFVPKSLILKHKDDWGSPNIFQFPPETA